MWNIEKNLFSTRGYAEIHIQRPFFNNKKGIQKIVVLKIQMASTCFGQSSTYRNLFFLKKIKISIFGGISKFFKLIVFWQILTKSSNFGHV
jgi:hypothetical protein